MKKMTFALCCAALSASAIELAAWRGETVTALVPPGEKIAWTGKSFLFWDAPAPKGICVKLGVAHDVKFVTKVGAFDYASVPDRVVWGERAAADGAKRVVSVSVAADAEPGTYEFGDMKLRVVDRVLPPAKEWKYYLDLWQHPWAVARAAGVEPFSAAHYAKMEPLWKMLAAAGQKTLTVSLVDLPWNHQCYDGYRPMIETVRHADGTWTHDFKLFDNYVLFGRYCGLGPHISCYTMCPWGYKVSWLDENGKLQKAEAKPGTDFFKEYWGSFLTDFAKHLKRNGWFNDTYISLDERSPEDLRNTVAFMQEKAPGLKIAMAGNRKPSEFNGIAIDSYSQSLGHVNPGFLAEVPQRQKEGKVTTYYICCGPAKPNTFMDSELDEAFWCGFYPAACGLDGLLRWAYNSWPRDACNDASYGNWRSGDTFFVYPDGSPSMRFLELVNGIQQAEKFNILKRAGERNEALTALAAKYDLKAALDKKPGDFAALVRETKEVLNREDDMPNTLSAAEKAAGWRLLWDGKTLDGWVGEKNGCKAPPEKGWKIENGVLTVLPRKGIKDGKWVDIPKEQAELGGGGDLVTVDDFRDFELSVDFRLTEAANSGIKYFYNRDQFKGTCEEYQILHEAHPDSTKGRDGKCRRVASLYDMMPANAEPYVKPLGEWNTAKIVSKGTHVEHWLNGHKVLAYERGSDEFRAIVAQSKYAKEQKPGERWGEAPAGRIKIQDHNDSTVSFRNIKIREL